MNGRMQDRIFAACGIGYVVAVLVGAGLAMATGKTHDLTVGSTPSQIAKAVASPAHTGTWAGAYLELVGTCLFLGFAVWAAARLGGGLLGSLASAAAVANVAATVVSLAIMDTISYRAGHGIGLQTATTLVTITEAIYVSTWFLMAAFLAALGAQALTLSRRALGWSAIGIAGYTLVTAAVTFDNVGQFSGLLAMVWVAVASVALARRRVGERAPSAAVAFES